MGSGAGYLGDDVIGEHEHCWHDTGVVLTSNPPIYNDICCHCGVGRQRKSFVQWEPAGHGKYLPGAKAFDPLPKS